MKFQVTSQAPRCNLGIFTGEEFLSLPANWRDRRAEGLICPLRADLLRISKRSPSHEASAVLRPAQETKE